MTNDPAEVMTDVEALRILLRHVTATSSGLSKEDHLELSHAVLKVHCLRLNLKEQSHDN